MEPASPDGLWLYDPATNMYYPVIVGAGLRLPGTGGTTINMTLNETTGAVEFDGPLTATGLTLSPNYGSAALFYVPTSTRIAPHASGTGMLQYNGTLLTKASTPTYSLKRVSDGSYYGVYAEQIWNCTSAVSATYYLPYGGDWTIDTANNNNFTTTHALTADSTDCSVLVSTGDPTGTFPAWNAYITEAIDEAKSIRAIFRVKVSSAGYSGGTGSIAYGITTLVGEEGVYIYVPYSSGTAGNIRVYAVDGTGAGNTSRYLTTSKSLTDDYHDIEVYISGTTFSVKYDGDEIAVNGSSSASGSNNGALAIRAMSAWEIADVAANPHVSLYFGSTGNRASATAYTKQIDVIEQ
jgi:hypothetical protein